MDLGVSMGKEMLQPGVLDDIGDLNSLQPELEMFVKDRVKWIPAFKGLPRHEAMPAPRKE